MGDVGMSQRRQELGLAVQAREAIGIGGEQIRKDLDGNVALQVVVAIAIRLSHPSFAERRENLVRPDGSSNGEGHLRMAWVALDYRVADLPTHPHRPEAV